VPSSATDEATVLQRALRPLCDERRAYDPQSGIVISVLGNLTAMSLTTVDDAVRAALMAAQ